MKLNPSALSWIFLTIGSCVAPPSNDSIPSNRNRLELTAEAFLQYKSVNGIWPPASVSDPDGKLLHSWRVLILPYLEANEIFNRYSLAVPWNVEPNSNLIDIKSTNSKERVSEIYCGGTSRFTQILLLLPNDSKTNPAQSYGLDDRNENWRATSSLFDDRIFLLFVRESAIHWLEPRDYTFDDVSRPVGKSSVEAGLAIFPDGTTKLLDKQEIENIEW